MPILEGEALLQPGVPAASAARQPIPRSLCRLSVQVLGGMIGRFLLYVRANIVKDRRGNGIIGPMLPPTAAAMLAPARRAAMLHRREDG